MSDVGVPDLDRFVAAAPPGATLRITRAWTRSSPLVVDRPVALEFEGAGSITMTDHSTAIEIASSWVCVSGARLVGPGGTVRGHGRGIRARATSGSPYRGLRVSGCTISDFSHNALEFQHVQDFAVASNRFHDLGHAGVVLFSCSDGMITDNTVTDVHQPHGYRESAGVLVSRDEDQDLRTAPRSVRVAVDRNRITRVRRSPGIEIRSGADLAVRENRVQDCRFGIAVLAPEDAADPGTRSVSGQVLVVGNHLERREPLGPGSGIVIRGEGTAVGHDRQRATTTITGNTIVGYGGSPSDAGIRACCTHTLVVSDNALLACVRAAVSIARCDEGTTVTRTLVHGLVPAESGGQSVAIEVGAASTALVMATRVLPGADGRRCSSGAVGAIGSRLTLLANDWSGADRAIAGAGTFLRRGEV
jgi:nitrous oxidase accessory protein NosD